ncbi:MAG: response regulator [Opitutae bacterium]|nr:response regulator [Opitutae bacterium]
MKSSRILIVDDDQLTRDMLEGWCLHCGAHCVTAGSTAEADEALSIGTFDAIICDVHLPGNRQLGWVRQIVAQETSPAVIMMTGNPELESTLSAANLAVAGYLVKPLNLVMLRELVISIVDNRRQQRALVNLSHATAQLLVAARNNDGGQDDQLQDHLLRLAQQLQAQSTVPRTGTLVVPLRESVAEAIAVLERTKHSFRSKDLGELRRRLQQTLDTVRISA